MEIRDKLRGQKLVMTMDVMRFLKNWLTTHIMDHDPGYAREFSAK